MDYIFWQSELFWLDNVLPQEEKKKIDVDEDTQEGHLRTTYSLAQGQTKVRTPRRDISVSQTVWLRDRPR